MSKFFGFRQNNSGGSFDFDAVKGISVNVIVEADDAEHANYRAGRIGLYFGGAGDCPCCGDRWHEAYTDGTDQPKIYDMDVSDGVYKPFASYDRGWSEDGVEGYIHYLDGRIVPVVRQKEAADGLA